MKKKIWLYPLILMGFVLMLANSCNKDDPTSTPTVGLPTVTTATISDITGNTATSGGNITNDGEATVTARGVCWSTTENPTTASSKTSDGTSTGSFTSNLTNLTEGTAYYVRAYATNSVGTAYGNELSFTTTSVTTVGLPTVTTATISDITGNTATSGGNITNDGEATVTARGVCWSTTENPTTASNKTVDGLGTGSFTSNLTNLTAGTTYYVRAYATNSMGTAYGNELSFTTTNVTPMGDVTNPITGKTWMNHNLGASQVATSSTDAAAYGDLYQWGRATDGHESKTSGITYTLSSSDTPGHGNYIATAYESPGDWRSPKNNNLWQGVSGTNNPCPGGYRLPTEEEWEAEMESWSSPNPAGAFASPLKIPLPGVRNRVNTTFGVGEHGWCWTSTVNSLVARHTRVWSTDADTEQTSRATGLAVRCIKD